MSGHEPLSAIGPAPKEREEQWLPQQMVKIRCRLVAVSGKGGVGKSAAAATYASGMNTAGQAGWLTGRSEIAAVAGSPYRGQATYKQLEAGASAIGRRKSQLLAPCHCTGIAGQSYPRERLHSLLQGVGAGTGPVPGER
jgi:Mrp family chromosome partitioning ATPase